MSFPSPHRLITRWTAAALLGGLAFLSGCVQPQVAYNAKADFSNIHRVGVATFSGPNGNAAADILTQDLLNLGIDVIERQRLDAVLDEQRLAQNGVLDPETVKKLQRVLGVDAIFLGSVSSYSPGQNYLVQTNDAQIQVGSTVTPVSGRNVYPGMSVHGLPNTQVVTTASSVGLTARLVDVETGSVLWSARMSYEGFDTESAMSAITTSFAKSLSSRWPAVGGKR